jgi:hypothetical protein
MAASPVDAAQTIPIVGLLSGLTGALLSAYLSYIVRLRAKAREDVDERRRLAHVYFIALTDVVGSNLFVKSFVERMVKQYELKLEGFDFSHVAATLFATKFAETKPDDRAHIKVIAKGVIAMITESVKLDIDDSDLGRMNETAMYAYFRFQTATTRLKHSLLLIDSYFDSGIWNAGDAASLANGIFRAFGTLAESAGVLRAALQVMAGLSSDYSTKCLARSFNATQKELLASFAENSKLELATKAAQEAGDASEALGVKSAKS